MSWNTSLTESNFLAPHSLSVVRCNLLPGLRRNVFPPKTGCFTWKNSTETGAINRYTSIQDVVIELRGIVLHYCSALVGGIEVWLAGVKSAFGWILLLPKMNKTVWKFIRFDFPYSVKCDLKLSGFQADTISSETPFEVLKQVCYNMQWR